MIHYLISSLLFISFTCIHVNNSVLTTTSRVMGRGLTIFSHFIVTKMAIFLTVDYNEASMC